jgi:hypothetical protein
MNCMTRGPGAGERRRSRVQWNVPYFASLAMHAQMRDAAARVHIVHGELATDRAAGELAGNVWVQRKIALSEADRGDGQ